MTAHGRQTRIRALRTPRSWVTPKDINQTNAISGIPPSPSRATAGNRPVLWEAIFQPGPVCRTSGSAQLSIQFLLLMNLGCAWRLETKMSRWIAVLAAGLVAAWPFAASGDTVLKSSDAAIRIGNVMPYTGELAAFGAIG